MGAREWKYLLLGVIIVKQAKNMLNARKKL
jgi:hypothetical protein